MIRKWWFVIILLFVVFVSAFFVFHKNPSNRLLDPNFGVVNDTALQDYIHEQYDIFCYSDGTFSKDFASCHGLVLLPDSKHLNVKPGKLDGFGIIFKNVGNESGNYSYDVSVHDANDCAYDNETIMSWVVTGRSEENIILKPEELYGTQVLIKAPKGVMDCTFRLKVSVKENGDSIRAEPMDISVMS